MKPLFIFATFLALAGCKEALYSNLEEVEVNQMVAVLQAAEIASSRRQGNDGMYSIHVDKANIGAAVLLLQNEGLPRKKFADLGEIFADTGIVGTPFEERARFMFALNEELARTISSIDGVSEARVHVVLPETARFDRKAKLARAAVAIYHQDGFDAQAIIPTVKTLMAHSVPELDYDEVSISLFNAGGARLQISPSRNFIGTAEAATLNSRSISLPVPGTDQRIWLTGALAALLALLALGSVVTGLRKRGTRPEKGNSQ